MTLEKVFEPNPNIYYAIYNTELLQYFLCVIGVCPGDNGVPLRDDDGRQYMLNRNITLVW